MAEPNATELVEFLRQQGNGYRPPRNQGQYWDTVDLIERQQEAIARKDKILRSIVRTHMHNGHCTWCDSDAHEKNCFVAAAIAEGSRRKDGL